MHGQQILRLCTIVLRQTVETAQQVRQMRSKSTYRELHVSQHDVTQFL